MKEDILALTGGDTTNQQQYLTTTRRSEQLAPEKTLLIAILEDAIHTYRKYQRARDRVGRERFREAEEWILENDNEWIFSFNNVCELLGFDPDFARHGVIESINETTREAKSHSRTGTP